MRRPTDFFARFSARRIGATARQALAVTGHLGTVVCVVSGCIYLAGPGSQLVWLAKPSLPLHARSVQLAGELPGLLPEMTFQVRDQEVVFLNGVSVSIKRAEGWQPSELPWARHVAFGEIFGKSRILYSHLAQLPRTGFGELIEPILALGGPGGPVPPPQFSDHVLRIAWPAVQAIALACAHHDLQAVLAQITHLVGLGNGLTPSGDDFLGGLFFGLHALNDLFPAELGLEMERVKEALAATINRTNLISGALLSDLAAGQGPEPLHDLVSRLLTPARLEPVLESAWALASIGHSTGWDVLTGLLAGLLWTGSASMDPCIDKTARARTITDQTAL
jgi:hypothetical protein